MSNAEKIGIVIAVIIVFGLVIGLLFYAPRQRGPGSQTDEKIAQEQLTTDETSGAELIDQDDIPATGVGNTLDENDGTESTEGEQVTTDETLEVEPIDQDDTSVTDVGNTLNQSNGTEDVEGLQKLAQDAYAIFDENCIDCHSEFGAYSEMFVIQRDALIKKEIVVPNEPNDSELYTRLLEDAGGSRMPLDQEPLDSEAIATIRRWIEAGAPDWEAIPKPERRFITHGEILKKIHDHLTSLPNFDRPYARYFTLTHLYNAGSVDENLRAYRNALSKLVNSLSWGKRVKKPTSVDEPEDTIFYIDLRDYQWDHELESRGDPWYKIQRAYPYIMNFKFPTYKALCQATDCEVPFVRADWFIATASLPPLYHDILNLPKMDRELEAQLEVNVDANLKVAPGRRVWRAGFGESGVSRNNRVVERHESQHGAYWKSYDFRGNTRTQNIFSFPLTFTHDGGEIIFNLPNGLQAYYITDASGDRLDDAPTDIVSTGERDPVVRNGLSCMGCHTEGIKRFTDRVRSATIASQRPHDDKEQTLRLYVEKSTIDTLIGEDIARYKQALEETGGVFGGREPIQQLVKQFEGPLDAAHAAAEVGLETANFLQKIHGNNKLQAVGLTVLGTEGGTIKRDTWEGAFETLISELQLGSNIQRTFLQEEFNISRLLDMVPIFASSFQMGSNSEHLDEEPIHTVYVDTFYMDKYEVTNAEYKKFVDANPEWRKDRILDEYHDGSYLKDWKKDNYPPGKDDHPVVFVSWYAAMAYAKWAGKRLPTEAEWEKAARGRLRNKMYPWGNLPDVSKANYNGHIRKRTVVGEYPPNEYGLHDMAGNVREWCLDEYVSFFYVNSPQENPIAARTNIEEITNNFVINNKITRVCRGGSWDDSNNGIRNANRFRSAPTVTSNLIGFRCVSSNTAFNNPYDRK